MINKKYRIKLFKSFLLLTPFISSGFVFSTILNKHSISNTNSSTNVENHNTIIKPSKNVNKQSREYGDNYTVTKKVTSKTKFLNFAYNANNNRFIEVLSEYGHKIFSLKIQNGGIYPDFIEDVEINSTIHENSPPGFWGFDYQSLGRNDGEYSKNFFFGKTESGNFSGIVEKNGKPFFNPDETKKYEDKKLDGIIYLSQMTYWHLIGNVPPERRILIDGRPISEHWDFPYVDWADQNNGNWMSCRVIVPVFDGRIWTEFTLDDDYAHRSVSLELIDDNLRVLNVDEFLDLIKNGGEVEKYIKMNFYNYPTFCVDGKDNGSTICAWDDEQNRKVMLKITTPYNFKPDLTTNTVNSDVAYSSHNDQKLLNTKWFVNTNGKGMEYTFEIDYNNFKDRPPKQEVTSIKSNISINDFEPYDSTLNSTVFSVDFLSRLKEKDFLSEIINNNPNLVLYNPPSAQERNGRPICDKNYKITAKLDNNNSTVIQISARMLFREKYSNRPAIYKFVDFKISGFSHEITTVTNEVIDCKDTPLANIKATDVFEDTVELRKFLTTEDILRKIFHNTCNEFIKYNVDKLSVLDVYDKSLFDGTITVNILAQKYAYIDSGGDYQDIEATIKISGLYIPPDSVVKQDLNIVDLNIPEIDNSTYSIDIEKIDKYKNILISDMNVNREKYVDNLWEIGEWNKQFPDLKFKHEGDSLVVSGLYVKRIQDEKCVTEKFSTKIKGFNNLNTKVLDEYSAQNPDSDGFLIDGFEYTPAATAVFNERNFNSLVTQIKRKLPFIYENYSQYFLKINSENIKISVYDVDNINGEIILEMNSQMAYYNGEYTDLQSFVKITGFKKLPKLPNYNIVQKQKNTLFRIDNSSVLASSLNADDIKNLIFENRTKLFDFSGEFIDLDNPIWWRKNLVIDNFVADDRTGSIEVNYTLLNSDNKNSFIKEKITFFGYFIIEYQINFKSSDLLLNANDSNKKASTLSKYEIKEIIIKNRNELFVIPENFKEKDNIEWWENNINISLNKVINVWGLITLDLTLKNSDSFGSVITTSLTINGLKKHLDFNNSYIGYDDESGVNTIDGAAAIRNGMTSFNWNITNKYDREDALEALITNDWKYFLFSDSMYFKINYISKSYYTFDDESKLIVISGLILNISSESNVYGSYSADISLPTFIVTGLDQKISNEISDTLVSSSYSGDNFTLWITIALLSITSIALAFMIWFGIKARKANKEIVDDYFDI